jgi:hypothetical protein
MLKKIVEKVTNKKVIILKIIPELPSILHLTSLKPGSLFTKKELLK